MSEHRGESGYHEARCRHCGAWRRGELRQTGAEAFFVHWQVVFTCCGESQTVFVTVEKDELDFH